MNKKMNILMAGVGGQGVLLASEILCDVMMNAGFDVKKSEVHGMAQRGGSVTSHVIMGEKVYSPIIRKGEADMLFSFEILETMRYLDYLKKDATILVNHQKILPPSVSMGKDNYPDHSIDLLKSHFKNVSVVNALDIARQAGNPKALNVVFIGSLSKHFDVDESLWHKAIENILPPKLVPLNIKAFGLGRSA